MKRLAVWISHLDWNRSRIVGMSMWMGLVGAGALLGALFTDPWKGAFLAFFVSAPVIVSLFLWAQVIQARKSREARDQ